MAESAAGTPTGQTQRRALHQPPMAQRTTHQAAATGKASAEAPLRNPQVCHQRDGPLGVGPLVARLPAADPRREAGVDQPHRVRPPRASSLLACSLCREGAGGILPAGRRMHIVVGRQWLPKLVSHFGYCLSPLGGYLNRSMMASTRLCSTLSLSSSTQRTAWATSFAQSARCAEPAA